MPDRIYNSQKMWGFPVPDFLPSMIGRKPLWPVSWQNLTIYTIVIPAMDIVLHLNSTAQLHSWHHDRKMHNYHKDQNVFAK